jgi:hypothetical protein
VLVVSISRCGNSCGNYRAGLLYAGAIFYSTLFSMKLFDRSLKGVNGIKRFRFNIDGYSWIVDTNLLVVTILMIINTMAMFLLLL